MEERERGKGHRGREVRLFEEAHVAHEGLWTKHRGDGVTQGVGPPSLPTPKPQAPERKPESSSGLWGTFQLETVIFLSHPMEMSPENSGLMLGVGLLPTPLCQEEGGRNPGLESAPVPLRILGASFPKSSVW